MHGVLLKGSTAKNHIDPPLAIVFHKCISTSKPSTPHPTVLMHVGLHPLYEGEIHFRDEVIQHAVVGNQKRYQADIQLLHRPGGVLRSPQLQL